MKENGHNVGLTMTIRAGALVIDLKASNEATQRVTVKLKPSDRRKLVERHMAVLSLGGRHEVTPYFDEHRRPSSGLDEPAPFWRWRFAGDAQAYGLFRARRALGGKAPASLVRTLTAMLDAADDVSAKQQSAIASYERALPKIARDVARVGGAQSSRALAALAGVSLAVRVPRVREGAAVAPSVRVTGSPDAPLRGKLHLAASPSSAAEATEVDVAIEAGETLSLPWSISEAAAEAAQPVVVSARAELEWRGTRLSLGASETLYPGIPCWQVVGPFDNPGGAPADVAHPVEKGVDLAATYRGKKGDEIRWKRVARTRRDRADKPFVVNFNKLYGKPRDVAAYAVVWVDSPRAQDAQLAIGSEDGFVAWVNGERIFSLLEASRTYKPKDERHDIQLREGRNEVLLKITLTAHGWKFGAHLLAPDGGELRDVTYSTGP
jgi:hypothetical protein